MIHYRTRFLKLMESSNLPTNDPKDPNIGTEHQTTPFPVSVTLPESHSPSPSPGGSPGLTSSPKSAQSPGGSPGPARRVTGSGRHPVYRGIRLRNSKWVSEIREPRKTTRIWLGTYPVPEMAAAAYDVAALALKGSTDALNFPGMASSYPTPASTSDADIRVTAARAAEMKNPVAEEPGRAGNEEAGWAPEFVDEEALLNMPNLLTDMAEGMLMSPPRMHAPSRDDSPEIHDGDSLWSYK